MPKYLAVFTVQWLPYTNSREQYHGFINHALQRYILWQKSLERIQEFLPFKNRAVIRFRVWTLPTRLVYISWWHCPQLIALKCSVFTILILRRVLWSLLLVLAVGCTDLIPPEDSWMKREDNRLIIGCYMSRQTWQLQCVDGKWIGVVSNCTQGTARSNFAHYVLVVQLHILVDCINYNNIILLSVNNQICIKNLLDSCSNYLKIVIIVLEYLLT